MTINVSTLGGGGAGFRLAPDLNYFSNLPTIESTLNSVTVDTSGGVTALSLSGKFVIGALRIRGINGGTVNLDIELIIDGITIIDESLVLVDEFNSVLTFLSGGDTASFGGIICEESLVLNLNGNDTDITVDYSARPIL